MEGVYLCPKCDRYGMSWDARAKVLMCFYKSCSHVIRVPEPKKEPIRSMAMKLIWNQDETDELQQMVLCLKRENDELRIEVARLNYKAAGVSDA